MDKPPSVWRVTAAYWGVKSSGVVAMQAIVKTFEEVANNENSSKMEKHVALTAPSHFYVDDGSFSQNGKSGILFSDEDDMFNYYETMHNILIKRSFLFRKIVSNSSKFLSKVPKERLSATKVIARNYAISENVTQLGYQLNLEKDTLQFDQYKDIKKFWDGTKKSLASLAALVFDPLCLFAGWTLVARQVLQKTFETEMKWKDKIEKHVDKQTIKKLNNWLDEIEEVSKLQIPRSFKPTLGFKDSRFVMYSDASISGIGACCYCISTWPDGKITSELVMTSARASPMKDRNLTIPRLELRALTVSINLYKAIIACFQVDVSKFEFFSDSKTVLYWTRKKEDKMKPFFANRVRKWNEAGLPPPNYVNTKDNPADEISRGMSIKDLKSSKYWHGPSYHLLPREKWPIKILDKKNIEKELEITEEDKLQGTVKKHQESIVTFTLTYPNQTRQSITGWHPPQRLISRAGETRKRIATEQIDRVPFITRFSEYENLIRKYGILLACKDKWICKLSAAKPDSKIALKHTTNQSQKLISEKGTQLHLENRYYQQSRAHWIALSQSEMWPEEYDALQKGKPIRTKSPLYSFTPFMDSMGCIRMDGRLQKAELSYDEQNPFLLNKSHILTNLIIRHYHLKYHHASPSILNNLMRRHFWIISGRISCRKVVEGCFICKKSNGRLSHQKMGPLHQSLISSTNPHPFRSAHIDYTGALSIVDKYPNPGTYETPSLRTIIIALFTDPLSRWLHVELVNSNSGPDLLDAWTRFIAVCGEPDEIYTDGAGCFKFCKEVLQEKSDLHNKQNENHPGLQYLQAKTKAKWEFIISAASNRMSIIENQVKCLKKALYKTFQPRMTTVAGQVAPLRYLNCTIERLQTVLAEITTGLNDRIIASQSVDLLDNPLPITPSLLHLNRYLQPTITTFADCKMTLPNETRKTFQTRQAVRQEFLDKYYSEIVPILQRTFKWTSETPPLRPNDIVLCQPKSEVIKRQYWLLGTVKETYKGGDGRVRSLKIHIPRRHTKQGKMENAEEIMLAITQVCPLETQAENKNKVYFKEKVKVIEVDEKDRETIGYKKLKSGNTETDKENKAVKEQQDNLVKDERNPDMPRRSLRNRKAPEKYKDYILESDNIDKPNL